MAGVDVSTNGHAPTEEDAPSGWRWYAPRVIGVTAFVFMVVFWIYVFANGSSIRHPDDFDDPAFSEAAEAVCAARQDAIAALPPATSAGSPAERSDLVDLGTDQLALMLDEVDNLAAPADPDGAAGLALWLDDYKLYINDRRAWADTLRSGEDAPFLVSGNDQGVRVTDMLITFAEVNDMASCAPSGDV